jgi:hypothetical protein
MTMTLTGNEPAQPNPVDPATLPPSTDPDEIELREAQAAAKTEDAAGQAKPADQVTTPAPDKPADAPQPQPSGQPEMVPHARFHEVNLAKGKAEQDAAYWRGVAEARAQQAPAAGGQPPVPQPQQQTPEAKLAEIGTAIDALAKKFDDGEITMADFKKQERELTNKEAVLREEAVLAKVKLASAATAPQSDELYLETLTVELEKAHPWITVADKVGNAADWKALNELAYQRCVENGKDPTKGTFGKYEIRKAAAEIADEIGPSWFGPRATKAGIPLPGQSPGQAGGSPPQPQPQPGKPALSPAAQQRQTKLEQAAGAPPNLSSMTGAVGPNAGAPSDSALEAMTDDEIAALPAATRNKLLGIDA